MKKWLMFLMVMGLVLVVGCGANTSGVDDVENRQSMSEQAGAPTNGVNGGEDADESNDETHGSDGAQSPEDHAGHPQAALPTEPGENEACSMCNMVVYHRNDPMGRYTGQVVTADGRHLFTDDIGCLMNQIRILEEKPLGAWVRDYNTLEWIPVDEAVPVRASLETPMKMGFALFGTREAAEEFLAENPQLSPVIATMEDVDKIALERRKAKMKAAEEQAKKADGLAGHEEGPMNGNMQHGQ